MTLGTVDIVILCTSLRNVRKVKRSNEDSQKKEIIFGGNDSVSERFKNICTVSQNLAGVAACLEFHVYHFLSLSGDENVGHFGGSICTLLASTTSFHTYFGFGSTSAG